jgi:hypothetical protein
VKVTAIYKKPANYKKPLDSTIGGEISVISRKGMDARQPAKMKHNDD